jgi:hypothetical protein
VEKAPQRIDTIEIILEHDATGDPDHGIEVDKQDDGEDRHQLQSVPGSPVSAHFRAPVALHYNRSSALFGVLPHSRSKSLALRKI